MVRRGRQVHVVAQLDHAVCLGLGCLEDGEEIFREQHVVEQCEGPDLQPREQV